MGKFKDYLTDSEAQIVGDLIDDGKAARAESTAYMTACKMLTELEEVKQCSIKFVGGDIVSYRSRLRNAYDIIYEIRDRIGHKIMNESKE